MSKLILIMIDGISADYFATCRKRMPHLSALADKGFLIKNLHADMPATSLTGRTTMITGVTADVHGVWGNIIWDGEAFRYANPDDVRVPTLPKQAKYAGLDVACLGYGMVRPEDASVFHHAWWANEMLQRARDLEPIQADESWLRTSRFKDPTGRIAALAERGYPDSVPDAYAGDEMHYIASEFAGDQIMMQWISGIATSNKAPDFILSEILTPDSIQHYGGYKSHFGHWSISYADALIGTLVEELWNGGRLDDYTLAIMSDHGHGAVHSMFHMDIILPNITLSSEGATLHVLLEEGITQEQISQQLAEYGIEQIASNHVPKEHQAKVLTFVAPEGYYFGKAPEGVTEATGLAPYTSMHGFKPGNPADDRFAIFHGNHVPRGQLDEADAVQIAPTLAKILGLSLEPYPAKPIF